MISDKWIDDTLYKAKAEASDLQPWHDYFESKARELRTILRFSGCGDADSVLEIGCGNGFTALLLSEKAKRVEAFDLPLKDPVSHSMGIGAANELVKRLNSINVHVTGGSAETLPFKDGSFRLIFSEYALQYVKNKDKALMEMHRVLTDDGRIIMVVPNFMERVFSPIMKYKYAAQRILSRIFKSGHAKAVSAAQGGAGCPQSACAQDKLAALRDQLLLRPDGAYKSFMEEMFRHTPGSWKKLFERNGFKVVNTFSTQILPLGVFDILGTSVVRFLSHRSHYLNDRLGGLPLIKNIGYSIGLVIEKG
ncbi:MAG: class I SAM-dependent methyltransferase [Candidatus Omnitrophica bacterium]|nr:class I SAM-dependent methyltransferase [Candidatus Omnitrophota bacterium]